MAPNRVYNLNTPFGAFRFEQDAAVLVHIARCPHPASDPWNVCLRCCSVPLWDRRRHGTSR